MRRCGKPFEVSRIAFVSNCCADPEFPWTKMTGVGGFAPASAATAD
jgi:hypothetical protein